MIFFQVYNTMFLDIVGIVKTNVENSITRLGLNGIKILNLVGRQPISLPKIWLLFENLLNCYDTFRDCLFDMNPEYVLKVATLKQLF